MTLSADRATVRREGGILVQPLAAAVVCYAGGILMRNAAGYLTKGATATGLVGVGVAQEAVTGGAGAGDKSIRYREGVHQFKNSTAGDLIAQADVGNVCYAVDDEQVAKTNATNTRSPAGIIRAVDAQGVWVEFNESLLEALIS